MRFRRKRRRGQRSFLPGPEGGRGGTPGLKGAGAWREQQTRMSPRRALGVRGGAAGGEQPKRSVRSRAGAGEELLRARSPRGRRRSGRPRSQRNGGGGTAGRAQGLRRKGAGLGGRGSPKAGVWLGADPREVRGLGGRGSRGRFRVTGAEGRCTDSLAEGTGRVGWDGVGRRAARILTPPECGPPCAPRRDRPPPRAARRSHAAAARTAPR